MCGFFCITGSIPKNFNKLNFINSGKLISHRGPDDKKIEFSSNYALSFYRLSLRDLSLNGRQPMKSSCGRYIICFNGEIYNSDYLKKKYLNKIKLKSTSDTEILLECFKIKKENIVNELEGMFSMLIYDLKDKKTFLIRDRLGIKPLYYKIQKNYIIVSSEIKPILNFSNKNKFNYLAFADFFFKGSMDYNKTFFKDVEIIKPGEILIYNNNSIRKKTYWSLKNYIFKKNNKNVGYHINSLLNDSVYKHLVSDVKIGSFLSGGTDSSILTSTATKFLNYKMSSFTYDFQSSYKLSESSRAKIISKKLNINNYKILVKPDYIINNFDDLLETVESPITSIRLFGTYKNYAEAKKRKLKIILEGQGGDEIFGGYKYNYIYYFKDLVKNAKKNQNIIKKLLKNNVFKINNINDLVNFYITSTFQHGSTSDGVPYVNLELFNNDFVKKYLNDNFYSLENYSENNLINSQCRDIYEIKLPRVLRYTDRLSMKNGIETRVPLLDHKLVEFGINLDPNLKFNKNQSRWIIKRFIKNKFIYEKNKKTIVDPQKSWFKTYLKDFVFDTFNSQEFKNNELFNSKRIIQYYENYLKYNSESSFNLIQILSAHKFLKIFKKII